MSTGTVTPEVDFPELKESEEKAALVLKEFGAIVKIETPDQYLRVASYQTEAATNIKRMEEHIDPFKTEAYSRWKRICDVLNRKTEAWRNIKERSSRLTGAYQYEQEQIRLKKEQEERQRIAKEEQERIAREATQLADEGRVAEGLAHLEDKPEVLAPVVVERVVPKVAGISAPRIAYGLKITDLKALVDAVAAGKLPLQVFGEFDRLAKEWNLSTKDSGHGFLNKTASMLKEAIDYPGCELVKSVKSSTRG
jgi:hypothetical protein